MTHTPATFKDQVYAIVAGEVEGLRQLSTGATPANPHAGLLGSIDDARARYVTAAAALAALERTHLARRSAPLVDARTPAELREVLKALALVKLTVTFMAGSPAGEPVQDMLTAVAKRLEAGTKTWNSATGLVRTGVAAAPLDPPRTVPTPPKPLTGP